LTEIYLCHACSCQEIWRAETAGQVLATDSAQVVASVGAYVTRTDAWECTEGRNFDCAENFGERSILAEIYLCHACSCHEIEDGNARTGGADSALLGRLSRYDLDHSTAVRSAVICGGGCSGGPWH
jgi:hypothetical protein